jgi:hypothetical protein
MAISFWKKKSAAWKKLKHTHTHNQAAGMKDRLGEVQVGVKRG